MSSTHQRILENKATGYMKIFRSLKGHWIWADEKKLKWWLDLMLTVNYSDQKVLLKGTLIECKRGQSIRSLESWAKDWRTTKKTVQSFFKLLQKDKMILVENVKITTRITVCNYDSYNVLVNGTSPGEETEPTTGGKRSLPPNNKDNKDNKEIIAAKQKSFGDSLIPFIPEYGEDLCKIFYDYWSEPNKSMSKIKWELEKTFELKRRLDRFKSNDKNFNKRTTEPAATNDSNDINKLLAKRQFT